LPKCGHEGTSPGTRLFLPLTPITPIRRQWPGIACSPSISHPVGIALRQRFYVVGAVAACLVIASHLIALGSAPPGLFSDEAAFEPWFFHLGRTMLETDLLTPLFYVLPLGALAAGGDRRLSSWLAAGIALGAACFTAQPARFFTPALLLIVVFAFRHNLRGARLAAIATPVVLAVIVLVIAGGAATARLGAVSVFGKDGIIGGAREAVWDYLQYQGPLLLFIRGDSNLRHSTGFEG